MLGYDIKKVIITKNVITQTTSFLQQQGLKCYEGKVYWIGHKNKDILMIDRAAIPKQIPRRTILGVSITVPESANLEVARSLKNGDYIAIKVHSHPGKAYMSDTDKANPSLKHGGAISIVVPNYARYGIDNLSSCSVSEYQNGRWRELTAKEIEVRFEIS